MVMASLWMRLQLTILFSILLVSCAKHGQQTQAPTTPPAAQSEVVKLIHWNDFHGQLFEIVDKDDPKKASGGLAWFMSAIEAEKAGFLPLILDGGDQFQGSSLINDSLGMGMVTIMNALGLDATCIGNHDFDYASSPHNSDPTRGALYAAMAASNFAWLAANITQDPTQAAPGALSWPPPQLKPYVIVHKGPYRIAVIGLSTLDTPVTTLYERVKDLRFEPVTQTLARIISELNAQKPDFIVVLGHLTGTPQGEFEPLTCPKFDGEVGEILAMPKEIKDRIGALLLGHMHQSFAAVCDGLLIAENKSSTRSYTTVQLKPDEGKLVVDLSTFMQRYLVHKAVEPGCSDAPFPMQTIDVGGLVLSPSKIALQIIAGLEKQTHSQRCEALGCAKAPILRAREGECPIGNLVVDAMMKVFPQADVAVQNTGGLRTDILKDTLYREDVEAIMPFENYIYLINISGADLRRIFRVATSGKHGIFQVAGMQYAYWPECNNPQDLNNDGQIQDWEHNCLDEVSMRIAGRALDDNAHYKVAINNFLFDGGDSLKGLFDAAQILQKGPLIKSALIDYVQKENACFDNNTLLHGRVQIKP